MHANVHRAAFRPLAIKLSFLRRIPSSDARIEYAVTTQARAKANWPICAAMLALSYACSGFLFVFGRALGLHFGGDEHAIMSKLAFHNGLCTVYECIGGCIGADVLYGESLDSLCLFVLLADHEVDDFTFVCNGSGNHVPGDL